MNSVQMFAQCIKRGVFCDNVSQILFQLFY